jgi:hypothetical protein
MNNTTTQKRKVGRPRKEETAITTKRDFESEILEVKKVIEDLRTRYHQIETSFTSRVEKIKDKMYGDYMERRRIYEEEVERLTKKIVKQETRKFVEGQILTKKSWSEKVYILVTKVTTDEHGFRFHYNTIGVSGVGTKTNRYWMDIETKDTTKNIEVVCDTKNFVLLCNKYGIKKPKLNKMNMDIIYQGVFNKKLNGEFNYSDLQKLGIITK